MIEESGIVESVGDGELVVVTQRQSTCGGCAAQAGCGTGVLSKWLNRRSPRVRVLNRSNQRVQVGDPVIIGVDERALVGGSLAVYLVPILLLFLVTAVADIFAGSSDHYGEGFVALAALSSLLLSGIWIRYFSSHIKYDKRYQPVLLRQQNDAASACSSPAQ